MGPGEQQEIYPGSAGWVRLDVGGWISGPAEDIDGEEMPNSGAEFRTGAGTIDRNRARREKFLANHPEWQIANPPNSEPPVSSWPEVPSCPGRASALGDAHTYGPL